MEDDKKMLRWKRTKYVQMLFIVIAVLKQYIYIINVDLCIVILSPSLNRVNLAVF